MPDIPPPKPENTSDDFDHPLPQYEDYHQTRTQSRNPPVGYTRPGTSNITDDDRRNKRDFLLGMFGLSSIQAVVTIFMIFLFNAMLHSGSNAISIILSVQFLFLIAVCAIFLPKERGRIVVGYLVGIFLMPVFLVVLVFGACLVLMR